MFFGSFNISIQKDGYVFGEKFDFYRWTDEILKYKGQVCYAYFNKEDSEILFSFIKDESYEEELIPLYSFIVDDNFKKQFYIPKDYLKYYPDKTVRIIGLDNAFCVSGTVSEESEMSSEEFEKLIAEIENLNDGN